MPAPMPTHMFACACKLYTLRTTIAPLPTLGRNSRNECVRLDCTHHFTSLPLKERQGSWHAECKVSYLPLVVSVSPELVLEVFMT